MKNSEIAERAIEIMERDGWCRDWYGASGEPGCLVGTVRKVLSGNERLQNIKAGEIVYPAIQDLGLTSVSKAGQVIGFNDSVLTSKADAIDTLTRAAKYWRDRGE